MTNRCISFTEWAHEPTNPVSMTLCRSRTSTMRCSRSRRAKPLLSTWSPTTTPSTTTVTGKCPRGNATMGGAMKIPPDSTFYHSNDTSYSRYPYVLESDFTSCMSPGGQTKVRVTIVSMEGFESGGMQHRGRSGVTRG